MILTKAKRRFGGRALAMAAILAVAAVAVLALARPASAAPFTVTKTADTNRWCM